MERKFITATKEKCSFDNHIAAPYIRKSFVMDFVPEKAVISVCGLGFYKLFINGKDITKGALAPYISNPDHYCYYDTYDVSELLLGGENVIGVILGNGFYNPFGGKCWGFEKAPWVSSPVLAIEFSAEAEHDSLFFSADETFKTCPSPIIFDELRMGEHYDANLSAEGWNMPGFDDSNWENAISAPTPRGEMKRCDAEPIKVIKEIKPVEIFKSKNGYIYDFGENNAGVCRLTVNAEKNQKIEMYHAEILKSGELDRSSIGFSRPDVPFYEEYNQKDIYIAKGEGTESYTPSFTYHGFRYVEVRGITEKQATENLLTYCIMRSGFREIASFSCSDETVNTLFEMAKRADESNFYYFPTDCPHREKNGWTGDAALSADHMAMLYDVSESFHEWLNNIRKSQADDGALPGIVPNYDAAYDWGNGPAWDYVAFKLPYVLYRYKNDTDVIKENASMMIRYLEYVMKHRDEKGTVSFGLGDFMPVGNRRNTDYDAPVELTGSIMIMDAAKKAAEMFEAVGYKHQHDFAYGIYKDMRETVRCELIDKDSLTVKGNCQSSQAMALYYGVFEKDEEEKAFVQLLRLIHDKDDRFDCGVLGMHTLFHVLSDFGEGELAFKLITQKGYPSYAHLIDKGETTLVESFKPDGFACGSHNHHMFGDISRWFINRIAGITIVNSNSIEINPDFIDSIEYASASCELPAGKAEVSWRRENGKIVFDINCDEGIECIKIKETT